MSKPYLVKARDLDPAPVRATSTMNETIRNIAEGFNLPLVDVERLVDTISPRGVSDDTLFIDNVHPTPLGNLQIAKAAARAVIETSPTFILPETTEFNRFWDTALNSGASSPQLDANLAFTWGQIFLRKGRLDKAEEMLTSAIAQGYSHPSASYYLADTLARKGSVRKAFDLLYATVQKHPNYHEPLPLLARLAASQNRADIAIGTFGRILKGGNMASEDYSAFALLLLKQGKVDEAEQVIGKGLVRYPGDCDINSAKGRILERQGQIKKAEEAYRLILEKDLRCQTGWENLGLLQMNQQRFPAAIATFTKALDQPGAVSFHHLNLGLAYHHGRIDQAKAYEQFRIFADKEPELIEYIPQPYRGKILAE